MKSVPILPLIRIALGALFLWAGFLKLIEPWQNFQAVVETYRIVQGEPAKWIAMIFPWIEAIGGLYLLTGLYTRVCAAVLWAMNTSFLAALLSALARKLPLRECGCFGDALSIPPVAMLAIDVVLWFGLGAVVLWGESARRFSLDSKFKKHPPKTGRVQ